MGKVVTQFKAGVYNFLSRNIKENLEPGCQICVHFIKLYMFGIQIRPIKSYILSGNGKKDRSSPDQFFKNYDVIFVGLKQVFAIYTII